MIEVVRRLEELADKWERECLEGWAAKEDSIEQLRLYAQMLRSAILKLERERERERDQTMIILDPPYQYSEKC